MVNKNRESIVKNYYKEEYHSQYNLSKANIFLYNQIINLENISSIFEFGCNIGRHLNRLNNFGYETFGIDINQKFIKIANENGLKAKTGDEKYLSNLSNDLYDLCFSNSVICHMPPKEANLAINELKRICKNYVICFECVTKDHDFWWIHDYVKHGFKEVLTTESHLFKKNGAVYKLFIYYKNN